MDAIFPMAVTQTGQFKTFFLVPPLEKKNFHNTFFVQTLQVSSGHFSKQWNFLKFALRQLRLMAFHSRWLI